jgi:virulence-associated protein VagC
MDIPYIHQPVRATTCRVATISVSAEELRMVKRSGSAGGSEGARGKPVRRVSEDRVVETRVFRSGNSDAVRLPKRFGLAGRRVRLYLTSGDRVVIEPKTARRWPAGFLASFGRVTSDFEAGHLPPVSGAEDARAASRFRDGS